MKRRRLGKQGFTLIEAICAMTLLTIVFTGFMVMASSSSKLNIRAAAINKAFGEASASVWTATPSTQTVTINLGGTDCAAEVDYRESGREYTLRSFTPKKAGGTP